MLKTSLQLFHITLQKDMMPFQIVERPGFLKLMNVAVPHYKVPSRTFFSKTEIPKLYNKVRADVGKSLAQATWFAATTDLWTTNRDGGPYISFTVHYLTPDWQLSNYLTAWKHSSSQKITLLIT